jgi:hypothetical protein
MERRERKIKEWEEGRYEFELNVEKDKNNKNGT